MKLIILALQSVLLAVTMHSVFGGMDPNLGRWLSRDPIGEEGGINLYVYVANNPVNWVDVDGRFPAAPLSPTMDPGVNEGYDPNKNAIRGLAGEMIIEQFTGGAAMLAGVVCPSRSLSSRIKDFRETPTNWQHISASAELASSTKAKRGISIESVFQHKQTGETLHVHDVFKESGQNLQNHPTFRDYGKGN